jgi:signal peptide peptidase SppA
MDGALNELFEQQSRMRDVYRTFLSLANKPVAFCMSEGIGAVLLTKFERKARGERVHDSEFTGLFATSVAKRPSQANTAIVPLVGVALYGSERAGLAFDSRHRTKLVQALADDPSIASIVLWCDTPGGDVRGIPELADAVWAARSKKNVVAIVEPLCASAGYWIASQAGSIIACPSGDIGSVGVFMAHTDCSAFNEKQGMKVTYIHAGQYKVEGNSNEPLSDNAKAYYQSEVDVIHHQFVGAVARGRRVTKETVLSKFGQGRCFSAAAALRAGMIDHIALADEALMMAVNPSLLRAARLDAFKKSAVPPQTDWRHRRLQLAKAKARANQSAARPPLPG